MPLTYDPIATTTLTTSASSITFSGIPQTYTDLRVVWYGSNTAQGEDLFLNFNNIEGNAYSSVLLGGVPSVVQTYKTSSESRITDGAYKVVSFYPNFSNAIYDIFDYNTSKFKTVIRKASSNRSSGNYFVTNLVGVWANTNAITSIKLSPSGNQFAAGTSATIYGIKAA